MKKHHKTVEELDGEIDALFAQARPTAEAVEELTEAFSGLDEDTDFLAGYWKAQFVEYILKAMEEQKISRKKLAKRIGGSPQYVGRVLNEKANFTIDTMVKIAVALNMHPFFGMHHAGERVEIVPVVARPGVVERLERRGKKNYELRITN